MKPCVGLRPSFGFKFLLIDVGLGSFESELP
jgi:hypothetical protein